jgi:hypothetical protein
VDPENYQTAEARLQVHSAKLCLEYQKEYSTTGSPVLPISTKSKMPRLYLKFAWGNDNRILLNVLIQRRNLSKLLKRSGRNWIGLLLINRWIA